MIINKFNGALWIKYIDLNKYNVDRKIMFFGFGHTNESKCIECNIHDKCYSISDFIFHLSNIKCIDIFVEHNLLINININNLKDLYKNIMVLFIKNSNIKTLTNIELLEKYNKYPIITDILLEDIRIHLLGKNEVPDIFINKYDINFLKEIYLITYHYTEEFKLRFEYIKSKIIPTKNIRFHYFDIRQYEYSSTIIFPTFIKRKKSNEFLLEYNDKFIKLILLDINNIFNLILFILNKDNEKKGEIFYRKLYDLAMIEIPEYFNETLYQKIILFIKESASIINKQIEKSYIYDNFIKIYFDTLRYIYKYDYDEYISIIRSGVFLSELYSIPRLFKKITHKRKTQCDDPDFKNIIYSGGASHMYFTTKYIELYYSAIFDIDIFNEASINCLKLELPFDFFN